MPTAARLAAAVCYALVAFFASEAFEPLLPDGTQTAGFSEINALFGAFAGWRGNGREVGLGYARAVTTSLITVATLVFYALVFHSVYQMIELAMHLYYANTMEAVIGTFELAGEYGMMIVKSPAVVATLLIGGVIASWITEWVNARWS